MRVAVLTATPVAPASSDIASGPSRSAVSVRCCGVVSAAPCGPPRGAPRGGPGPAAPAARAAPGPAGRAPRSRRRSRGGAREVRVAVECCRLQAFAPGAGGMRGGGMRQRAAGPAVTLTLLAVVATSYVLQQTLVVPALPTIQRDLDTSDHLGGLDLHRLPAHVGGRLAAAREAGRLPRQEAHPDGLPGRLLRGHGAGRAGAPIEVLILAARPRAWAARSARSPSGSSATNCRPAGWGSAWGCCRPPRGGRRRRPGAVRADPRGPVLASGCSGSGRPRWPSPSSSSGCCSPVAGRARPGSTGAARCCSRPGWWPCCWPERGHGWGWASAPTLGRRSRRRSC